MGSRCLVGLLLALGLAACSRPSNEVRVQRTSDAVLSCFQIESQYSANLDSIGFQRADSVEREKGNLAAVAGVALLGPLSLMALDDGSAAGKEMAALIARNRRLETMAGEKGCPALEPDMDTIVAEIEALEAAAEAVPVPEQRL